MKKVNFNNIENLEIPDSWVEKALGLESELSKKKVVFVPRFYRTLAYAACFLLVCALSAALFMFSQKGDILPVQYPDINVTESTEAVNNNEIKNSVSSEPTSPQTEVQPTEKEPATDNSTQPATTETSAPTHNTDPTQSESNSGDDTVNPDNQPSGPDTSPEGPEGPSIETNIFCEATVDANLILSDNAVYCKIEEEADYGQSSPAISKKYPANVSFSGDKAYIYFNPAQAGVSKSGDYRYTFYNSDGDVIYSGTIYIFIS